MQYTDTTPSTDARPFPPAFPNADTIFDQAAPALAVIRDDYSVVRSNAAFAGLAGCPEDHIVGRSLSDFVPIRERSALIAFLEASQPTGTASGEFPIERRAGTLAWGLWTVRWLRSTAEPFRHGVLSIEDSTARRHTARISESVHARNDALLNSIQDLVVELDEHLNVIWANPAAHAFLGEGLEGRPLAAKIDDPLLSLDDVLKPIRSGEANHVDLDVWARRMNDGRRLLSWRFTPIEVGTSHNFIATARDVTDERHAVEALRQSQKMEAIARLAESVAHDFNNLLMGIAGCVSLARTRSSDPELSGEYLVEVERAAARGSALTRQLLAFGYRRVTEPTPVQLSTAIHATELMIDRLVGDDIQVAFNLTEDSTAHVNADQGQVEQILMNLVVNARDAMEGGGSLTVSTSRMRVTDDFARHLGGIAPGEYGVLSVRDTGSGMDNETRLRAFEPFFTTKPAGKGTGLGLATVYGIVTRRGGMIDIESALLHGTTVSVYLPVASPAAKRRKESTVLTGSELVLVVEDERLVRTAIRHYLESAGYRVIEASRGEEALILCNGAEPPSVLLTDMIMPGMDGLEVAKAVGAQHPNMKVIYMSGYVSNNKWQEAQDMGAMVMEKPFGASELTASIRSVLNGTC